MTVPELTDANKLSMAFYLAIGTRNTALDLAALETRQYEESFSHLVENLDRIAELINEVIQQIPTKRT